MLLEAAASSGWAPLLTWRLAGTSAQPFNPILGETYEASLSDGSRIYLEQASALYPSDLEHWAASPASNSHESVSCLHSYLSHSVQISHHPPISAFELEGPGGRYVFRGLSQPSVSYKTSGGVSIKTVARGYRHVEFADGGRIEVTYPHYYVKGEPGGRLCHHPSKPATAGSKLPMTAHSFATASHH